MSGRSGSGPRGEARMLADAPQGGAVLVAGIVLALLAVAALLVALLYWAGEFDAVADPLNLTEFGTPEAAFGGPGSDPS
ncbi:hypothetical protein [Sphingosinicella sp. CPCC 101087]|uniref:hypothetical protein n=1 Tax=Sphingosinicella sp. CPCC 101087 TaxID=2497754 RepID=UPI00101E0072|nr:hypothetical protein [Sphingosinicella sp. CPCC 101087]